MMEDIPMGGGSDLEESEPEPPKKTTARGKKAAPVKKAPVKKAPTKKAPTKRGKKVVSESEDEAEDSNNDESDDVEIVEAPKKRTNRAAVLRLVYIWFHVRDVILNDLAAKLRPRQPPRRPRQRKPQPVPRSKPP